jgi:hypothetical protein
MGCLLGLGSACAESTSTRDGAADAAAEGAAGGEPSRDAGERADASDAGPSPPTEVRFESGFVRAAHARPGGGFLLLLERPVVLRERWGTPDRSVVWLDSSLAEVKRLEAADGRAILDVVVHPSGEATLLEASSEGFVLVRLDAELSRRGESPLEDDAIYTDPPTMADGESRSRIEEATRDVGRLARAADAGDASEHVLLATRTGRHSVVAYRLDYRADAGFSIARRTLVVPAHTVVGVGLIGGTYDTFGQMEAQYAVHIARGHSGVAYVGVQPPKVSPGAFVRAVRAAFGDTFTTDPELRDIFVTRLDPTGARVGLSVVSTPFADEIYALRAAGDDALVIGRLEEWNEQGTGFDALVGRVTPSGEVTTARIDVARSDLAFDAVELPGGALLVVGASNYDQNPRGASISEAANTFARVVRPDGATTDIPLPNGPRHSHTRFVLPLAAFPADDAPRAHLFGGMLDGPGTHSGDDDTSLVRARGFVTVVRP